MKKNVFVELVYIEAHAGRPSTDFVVLRSDIEAYLPAAVNFALTKGFYTQKNQEGNGDIPTQFYQYFGQLALSVDNDRKKRSYFLMPKTLIALPSNRALRSVMDNCENIYTEIKDQQLSNIAYWENALPNERFYKWEGKRVYLYNKPALTEVMNITAIVESSELSAEDELAIPAGLEAEAIQVCSELVLGVRKLPVDRKTDGRNIN